jgi:NAD(P)-dependent dehydrogenase (short-subunit alcohol dehydrogenase family)
MSKSILVIGGTRGTGKLAIDYAIAQEYSVTLLARDPAKAKGLFGATVDIICGDVTQSETLKTLKWSTFAAIIYTVDITGGIGGRGFFASSQSIYDIVCGGVINTIDVAKDCGFKQQFILLTTLGLAQRSLIMNLLDTIKPGVVRASQDKAKYLVQSGLPYTIVQAGALHDRAISQTPLIILSGDLPMQLSYQISRHHLAQVLVATISNPATINQTFNVYGGQDVTLDPTNLDQQFQNIS